MATKAQMDALLAVPCPWCGVPVGERCRVRIGKQLVVAPTTLDGESHDARWLAATGSPARVLTGAVAERRGLPALAAARHTAPAPEREPVAVGQIECPW